MIKAMAALRRSAAVAMALVLAGCSAGVLDSQGPVGSAERHILFNSLGIMLAIVIPTIVATLAIAFWFRASNPKAHYRHDWAYSGRLELVVWSIPLLVITFLGGIAWIGSHDLDPARPLEGKALTVQVVSLDWKWLFIYPDQKVASVNQLIVPAATPIHFTLTSASVMNAFFIPQLGSMIYTMNGMTTQLNLQADKPGRYDGLSSHFSGDGFAGMHFTVDAVSQEAFQTWVQAAHDKGPDLDTARYTDFAKQSLNVPPATFRMAGDGLFQAIATQMVPPAPGPPSDPEQHDVSPRTGG